jgi:hypothetical protein
MVFDIVTRQARVHAERTGEVLKEAFKAVLETEAGQLLEELRKGPHCDEKAQQWQENLAQKRGTERYLARQEERRRARQEECRRSQLAAWRLFVQEEFRELELRKDGQLARLLGESLLGESPAALQRLASEDRKQAEEGLVALMRNGKVYYKHVEGLTEEDMPGRIAARKLRTTWLKERRDTWLGHSEAMA